MAKSMILTIASPSASSTRTIGLLFSSGSIVSAAPNTREKKMMPSIPSEAADTSDLADVAEACDPERQGREHQGHDRHQQHPQEDLAHRTGDVVAHPLHPRSGPPGGDPSPRDPVRAGRERVRHDTDGGAREQANDDLSVELHCTRRAARWSRL